MDDVLRTRHDVAIQLRLAGLYELSETLFETLTRELGELPELTGMLGRVYRDYGMLKLDQGQLDLASRFIENSLVLLGDPTNGDKLGDSSLDIEAEYANSLGFMARLLALQGSVGRALGLFEAVNKILSRHSPEYDDARVNNGVWWLKWMSPIERWRLAPRLIFLALRTSRVKKTRVVELIVLAIFGRRGYGRLKRFVR